MNRTVILVYGCIVILGLYALRRSVSPPRTQTLTLQFKADTLSEFEMFAAHGYTVVDNGTLVPTLRLTDNISCEQEFSSWLSVAKAHRPPAIPPRTLPHGQQHLYTMNGFAHVDHWYFNEFQNTEAGGSVMEWKDIPDRMRKDSHFFGSYKNDDLDEVFNAFEKLDIRGLRGAVIGTQRPWVEAMALKNGAADVVTVEYQKIVSNYKHLHHIHPYHLAENYKQHAGSFDFVATYSSLEHSGLGRYGDPMDPVGDLREARKIRCILRPGGLLFLGLPVGLDSVVFNAHRVYGRRRLAMMFAGYTLLHTFGGVGGVEMTLTEEDLLMHNDSQEPYKQLLFVLRKDDD